MNVLSGGQFYFKKVCFQQWKSLIKDVFKLWKGFKKELVKFYKEVLKTCLGEKEIFKIQRKLKSVFLKRLR